MDWLEMDFGLRKKKEQKTRHCVRSVFGISILDVGGDLRVDVIFILRRAMLVFMGWLSCLFSRSYVLQVETVTFSLDGAFSIGESLRPERGAQAAGFECMM